MGDGPARSGRGKEAELGFGPSGEERGEGLPVGPAAHERERGGSWARNERGRKGGVNSFFLFLKHISKANSKCKFKSI